MKKITTMFAIALLATVSAASYASASEGLLGVKTATDISASANAQANIQSDTSQHKGLLEQIKDRIDTSLRAGTVTQVNTDGSFKIQNKKGTSSATVTTSASTAYTKDGQPSDKTSLVVGAMVRVKGAFDKATSTIAATLVNVIQNLQGIHAKGTVTAISGTTVTVKADNGTVYSVDASKAQVFHTFWFGTGGDIKVGDSVTVWGTHVKDSTSISARWIRDISVKASESTSASSTM